MAFNIHVEMPSGASSYGYERTARDHASTTFAQVCTQLRTWSGFVADVVMTEERVEVQREQINVAAG